jgi:hypothetical protein
MVRVVPLNVSTRLACFGRTAVHRHRSDRRRRRRAARAVRGQAEDDALVHPGIPPSRLSERRTYIQVRPSSYVRGDGRAAAYDLQVWRFFPYNDFIASANHEADWEHMTISISDDFGDTRTEY